jgi:hypothetical protein
VKGEILMEHEMTDTTTTGAKSTLTTIVKFNIAICVAFAAIWMLAALLAPQYGSPLVGLSSIGFLLGLLVTISALNVRLRVELEAPDAAE